MQDFCFRIVVFGAIGLTVSNVAKARARPEGKLLGAIEMINREILNNTDFERIMLSILNTAMEVTNSDLSAAILLDGEGMTRRTFATASSVLMNDAGRLELDDAQRLVNDHCSFVMKSRQTLRLPLRRTQATVGALLSTPCTAADWPGWLLPLEIDKTPCGVIGVFSRSRLHSFSPDELRMLSSVPTLVAMAQTNAKLYRELAHRERDT